MQINKKQAIIVSIIVVAIVLIILMIAIIYNINKDKQGETKNELEIENVIEEESVETSDTTAPIIIFSGESYTVETGYSKNLVDVIMSVDDIDSNPTRELIGDYDLNTAGEYNVKYKITDSAGNETTKDFVLKVVDDYVYESNEEDITFQEAVELYKTEDTKVGIDVSKWQGEINWEEVKEEGVEFAIIRVAYQNGFDGDVIEDPYFISNMEGCKENSIPIAVYFSSYAKTKEEAKNQATWVCNLLENYNFTNINITFDWENWTSFNTLAMSLEDINNIADYFMEECVNLGYKTRLYSSKIYLEKVWKNSNNYSVWLANYTKQTTYEGDYSIWQFCQTGTINRNIWLC